MAKEGGEWIMQGLEWDNPLRVRSWRELIGWIDEVGFLPLFQNNYRRDGYDFDARWEDGLANIRHKKIMDCFETDLEEDGVFSSEYTGLALKRKCGFGKGGYKNFEGCVTELQMQTYLTIRDFRRKRGKKGQEYGMPVSIYARPEDLWGYSAVASCCHESPKQSGKRIYEQVQTCFPVSSGHEKDLRMLLR